MSRIGRAPITIPDGVDVKIGDNNHDTVKGPKGTIEQTLVPQMKISVKDGAIHVELIPSRPPDLTGSGRRQDDEFQRARRHALAGPQVSDEAVNRINRQRLVVFDLGNLAGLRQHCI